MAEPFSQDKFSGANGDMEHRQEKREATRLGKLLSHTEA